MSLLPCSDVPCPWCDVSADAPLRSASLHLHSDCSCFRFRTDSAVCTRPAPIESIWHTRYRGGCNYGHSCPTLEHPDLRAIFPDATPDKATKRSIFHMLLAVVGAAMVHHLDLMIVPQQFVSVCLRPGLGWFGAECRNSNGKCIHGYVRTCSAHVVGDSVKAWCCGGGGLVLVAVWCRVHK